MGTTNDAVNLILRGEPFRNFCHSFYDEFVEQNVEFRHRAGVKSLIIRRNLGGCCDWCQNLAGIYVYGEEPKDVYRRHDSCRCLVTSKFEGRGYQDVWSKKEYKKQKTARIERTKEYEKIRIEERKTRIKKAITINENAINGRERRNCYNATEKWIKSKSQRGEGRCIRKTSVVLDGKSYPIDGHKIKMKIKPIEEDDAKLITGKLGGTIKYNPNVEYPKGYSLGDYEYNGVIFDHKHITEPGPKTIKHRINNSIKKGQAENFVINLTGNPTNISESLKQIEEVYDQIDELKTVIVIKNNKIIKIYERI